jgi:tetratricopeptide (TPR) repeat protein
MASKRCSPLILTISLRESEVWLLLSDANFKELLKRLLTAVCLVLLARLSIADQRTALERAANAFNQGRYEDAQKQVDAAARADSRSPEVPNLRGAIFTRQKRYDEAAQQFMQALALNPKFYPAKLNLAEVKLLQGKYAEAAQEYQALKEMDPGSELLDFKLVLCALLDGEQNKASGMVDLMKFPGKTPAYYYARAAIALKRGEKESAQKYFENVRKYYSEEQCRYFVEALKEIDLTSPTASQQGSPGKPENSAAGSN